MKLLTKWMAGIFFVCVTATAALAQDGGITIDANGNTGVGTETPTATLDVNGDTKIQGDLTMTGKVKQSQAPAEGNDLVNKSYVDAADTVKFNALQSQINSIANGVLGPVKGRLKCTSGYKPFGITHGCYTYTLCIKPGYWHSYRKPRCGSGGGSGK